MRRLIGLTTLIALGVLLGFVVRLLWPRPEADPIYPLPIIPDR